MVALINGIPISVYVDRDNGRISVHKRKREKVIECLFIMMDKKIAVVYLNISPGRHLLKEFLGFVYDIIIISWKVRNNNFSV